MQKEIRVFLVEDDSGTIELLKSYLSVITTNLVVVGEAKSVESAIEQLGELQPDLAIMDVEIENGTSFDVIAKFQSWNLPTIFITAHSHYSLPALKLSAADFLLKPFTSSELKQALERAFQLLFVQSHQNAYQTLLHNYFQKNEFWLLNKHTGQRINVDEIVYIQADSNYSLIFSMNGKEMITKTLKEVEQVFEGMNTPMLRIHKSFLIQPKFVVKIHETDTVTYLQMKNGKQLEVSKRRKAYVLEQLKVGKL